MLVLILGSGLASDAQIKPVNGSLILNIPYTTYYNDYFAPASDKLVANIVFQDFNEPSWGVRFKLTIESEDIRIETKSDFKPVSPVTLTPGVPYMVQGSEWSDYFNINNVILSGITRNELTTNGKLPEGFYSFTLEVLDYNTGKELSNPITTMAWIKLNDEPITITPSCGEIIAPMDIQNIIFQWQLTGPLSPNSALTTAYKLFVYEVTDLTIDPINAIGNNKVLKVYESEDLMQSTLLYNMAMPVLDVGKTYVYQVKAFDTDGKDLFKNNGLSQVCWFSYGFPDGGVIELKEPENKFSFTSEDEPYFVWSAPDNLQSEQEVTYKLRIIQTTSDTESDLEMAMQTSPTWFEESTLPVSDNNGWGLIISKEIEPMSNYAWQVDAYTNGQHVAASEIFTFHGPSLLDKFKAGIHDVIVTSTDNADLTNLKGTGKIKWGENGEMLEVEFEDLNIVDIAGRYVLKEGEITQKLSDTLSIRLTPELEENGVAVFYPTAMKLNTTELAVKGHVEWTLPHPVMGEDLAKIVSKTDYINFDYLKLNGNATLNESNDFELMDPLDFRLQFLDPSDFLIKNNVYRLRLTGNVWLPEKVKDLTDARISLPFFNVGQLYYFTNAHPDEDSPYRLIPKTNITLTPKDFIFDFSESESPLKIDDQEWKGVYFNEFVVKYPKANDESGQIALDEVIETTFQSTLGNDFKGWVSSLGQTVTFEQKFDESAKGSFNTFPSQLTGMFVDIEHNALTDSEMKGFIHIPVIDKYAEFTYTIPISNGGFEEGYLDESLEHHTFTFSPYGGENRMDITIETAVFADKERLDMVVDVEIPYIDAELKGLSNFRVYGDYYIGFDKPNGARELEEQVEATYDDYTIYIDKIGAGLQSGEYVFSYSATMPLGDEVAGDGGAPRLNIASSASLGDDFAGEVSSSDAPPMDMPKSTASSSPETMTFDSMYIAVSSEVADLQGYLIMTKDDPEWGTSLQGGIKGDIKIPTQFSFGSNMILGTKDQLKYWYFDAWYVDESGVGIGPIFNMFNLLAFEGKVYRHMRQDINAGAQTDKPNFVIDGDVEFGAGMYLQIIDPQGGKKFMSDIGVELVVESDHFVVAMEGDISLLNTNTRTPGAAAALKEAAVKQAASELAEAALEQLGPIDITVPITSSTDLRVQADTDFGQFTVNNGGTGFSVKGDVSDVPAATLSVFDPNQSVTVMGSVEGAGSFDYVAGTNRIGFAYNPSAAASFDLNWDNTEVAASYNHTRKSGAFRLGIDQTLVDVALDKTAGTGSLELQVDANNRFAAEIDKIGKASFELQVDDVMVKVKADAVEKSGELGVQVGEDYVAAALNVSAGTGSLEVKIDQVYLDINASKEGVGELDVQVGDDQVYLLVDKPNGIGKVKVGVDGNNVTAMLDAQGMGSLLIDVEGIELGLSANKSEGSGAFYFDNGTERIDVRANKSAGTGYARVRTGSDSVVAVFEPDEKSLQLSIGEVYFGAFTDGTTKGDITFQQGTKEISLGANIPEKSGYLTLVNGEDLLKISGNASEKTANFDLVFDGVTIGAVVNPELNSLNFSSGDIAFRGEGNSDKGMIYFEKGSDSFGLGLDKVDGAGYLNVDIDGTKLDIEANKSTKSGSVSLETGDFAMGGQLSPELQSLFIKKGSDEFTLSTNGKTSGEVGMALSDVSIGFGLNTEEQSTFLNANKGEDGFSISANGQEKSGTFGLQLGSDKLSVTANTDQQALSLSIDNVGLDVENDFTTGIGQLVFEVDATSVLVLADYNNKSGRLNIKHEGIELDLAADYTAKTAEVNFKSGDNIAVGVGFGESTQTVSAAFDATAFTLTRDGSKGVLDFSHNNLDLGLEVDLAQKSGLMSIGEGTTSVAMALDLTAMKGDLTFKHESATFEANIGESAQLLELTVDDISASLSRDATTMSGALAYQNYSIKAAKSGSTPSLTLSNGTLEVEMSKADELTFANNGETFTLNFANPNLPAIKKDGADLALELAGGIGEIDFAEHTGGALEMKLLVSPTESRLVYSDVVTWHVIAGEKMYIAVNDGTELNEFTYYNSGGVSISRGDYLASYDPSGELKLQLSDSKKLLLTTENANLTYDDYEVAISKTAFDISQGDNQLRVSAEEFYIQQDEKKIALTSVPSLLVQLSESKSVTLTDEKLNVAYNSISAEMTTDATLSYSDGSRELSISAEAIAASQGVYGFEVTADKSLTVNAGTGKSISLSAESAEVTYGEQVIKYITDSQEISYVDPERSFEVSPEALSFDVDGKSMSLTKDYALELKDGTKDILSITPETFDVAIDDKKVSFSTSKNLKYQDKERSFEFSPEGVELNQGDYKLALSRSQEFLLQTAEDKQITINTAGVALTYGETDISFDKTDGLHYDDGARSFDLSGEAIELIDGENRIAFDKDLNLELSNGTARTLQVSKTGVNIKIDDKEIAFSTSKNLSYKDTERSFEVGSTGLEFDFDGNLIKIEDVNGKPAITLKQGEYAFGYADQQASFTDGTNALRLGGENYFELDYGTRTIIAGPEVLSYSEPSRTLSFGGENFVLLEEGSKSFAITTDKELRYSDDQRTIKLGADKSLSYIEGGRTFSLGGENIVAYASGTQEYKLYSAASGQFGIGVTYDDYSIALEAGASKPAKFNVGSPYGDVSISSDASRNIVAQLGPDGHAKILTAGSKGLSFTQSGQEEEIAAEQLSTAAEVDYSGPQYIGDKVTASAGGAAKGSIQMYYNSGEQHFIANASVKSVVPPCVEAAMAVEASPQTYRIDIGTEEERIQIVPSCSGFGGGGWFNLTPSEIGLGVFAGFYAKAEADLGIATIIAKVEAELGVRAKAQIDPSFKLLEAGVWVRVYIGLKVETPIDDFTIAEAELKGTLTIYFYSPVLVEGELSGYINICGIKGGFDMGFSEEI